MIKHWWAGEERFRCLRLVRGERDKRVGGGGIFDYFHGHDGFHSIKIDRNMQGQAGRGSWFSGYLSGALLAGAISARYL